MNREDAEFAFVWYSHSLAEIQSDARRLAKLGFFGATEKEFTIVSIDREVESIRKFLLDRTIGMVEDEG